MSIDDASLRGIMLVDFAITAERDRNMPPLAGSAKLPVAFPSRS